MKRIMINIPSLSDKKTENVIRELVRQINLILDDAEKDIKKCREDNNNG